MKAQVLWIAGAAALVSAVLTTGCVPDLQALQDQIDQLSQGGQSLSQRVDKIGQDLQGEIDRPEIPGPAGKDGTNGVNGTNGTNGTDGVVGKDGTNGVNGTDGTNGTDGVVGKNGTDGVNGTNGTNGLDLTGVVARAEVASDGSMSGTFANVSVQHDPNQVGRYLVTVQLPTDFVTTGLTAFDFPTSVTPMPPVIGPGQLGFPAVGMVEPVNLDGPTKTLQLRVHMMRLAPAVSYWDVSFSIVVLRN